MYKEWDKFLEFMKTWPGGITPYNFMWMAFIASAYFAYGEDMGTKLGKPFQRFASTFNFTDKNDQELEKLFIQSLISSNDDKISRIREKLPSCDVAKLKRVSKTLANVISYFKEHEEDIPDIFEGYMNKASYVMKSTGASFELWDELLAMLRYGEPSPGGDKQVEDPGNKTCDEWYELGLSEYNKGDLDSAMKHMRAATKADPKRIKPWKFLGLIQLARERLGEAKESFWKAIQLYPNDPEANIGMGFMYTMQGDEKGADLFFSGLMPRIMFNLTPFITLGRFFMKQGMLIEAENCFKAVLQLDEENATAWKFLSKIMRKMGDLGLAREMEEMYERTKDLPGKKPHTVRIFDEDVEIGAVPDSLERDV